MKVTAILLASFALFACKTKNRGDDQSGTLTLEPGYAASADQGSLAARATTFDAYLRGVRDARGVCEAWYQGWRTYFNLTELQTGNLNPAELTDVKAKLNLVAQDTRYATFLAADTGRSFAALKQVIDAYRLPEPAEQVLTNASSTAPDPIPEPTPPSEWRMESFTVNGVSQGGCEYWPFMPNVAFELGHRVWGYYPDTQTTNVTDAAVRCGAESHKMLRDLASSVADLSECRAGDERLPCMMKRIKDAGGSGSFFLWVNDCSRGGNSGCRPAKMWLWNGQNYRGGLWKWENTLSAAGRCEHPSEAQIRSTLNAAIRALSAQ
jgi:hypothetical protein